MKRAGAPALQYRARGDFLSMRLRIHQSAEALEEYLVAVAYVAATTALLHALRRQMDRPEASLFYLLAVVVSATSVGSGPAVMAAVLSFLAWNEFLIGPGFALTVERPHDWFTLFVFLVVGVVTGELAGRARARAAE